VEGVQNVTLSIPNLIGGEGHLDTFYPDINDRERNSLKKSARILNDAFQELNLINVKVI
jgi:L-lactate dehydrogenase